MKSKRSDAMAAFAKLLVLIAIFLLASHANAFTSMSLVAGNQIQEKHWFQFEEPMNDPTNEPSCEPTCKPTKRMDLDAELPSNQSSKQVMYCNASTQGPEGASNGTVQLRHNNQKKQVSFSDKPEPVEIEINPPQATNANSQNM
jgi:hypothetical protein